MEPGFQLKTSPELVFQVKSPGRDGSMVPNRTIWQATRRETAEKGGSVASFRHPGAGQVNSGRLLPYRPQHCLGAGNGADGPKNIVFGPL